MELRSLHCFFQISVFPVQLVIWKSFHYILIYLILMSIYPSFILVGGEGPMRSTASSASIFGGVPPGVGALPFFWSNRESFLKTSLLLGSGPSSPTNLCWIIDLESKDSCSLVSPRSNRVHGLRVGTVHCGIPHQNLQVGPSSQTLQSMVEPGLAGERVHP